MRRTVAKKLRKMMPEGYTPNQYREAKAIYNRDDKTQKPKLKVSKRQTRLNAA